MKSERLPADPERRAYFAYLNEIRRRHGTKTLKDIAAEMHLRAPSRISALLSDHLPVNEGQAEALLTALGGSYSEIRQGLDLYRIAESLPAEPAASRPRWTPTRPAREADHPVGRRVVGGLADVVLVEPSQLVRSAYLAQVRDIAPDTLIGRDGELAELAEFCAGPDRYSWWQGRPWAGKTALASWFVTHPPTGVDIVSFFITGRLAGQADSNAFLDAMIEQLGALVPDAPGAREVAGARVGVWLSLLASAAAQAEERARRLVVVVDGLDEDEAGAAPARGQPSIASLLPRRPPSGSRFIVTSRPDPGLPDDVPSGHPLCGCTVRSLAVSWVAEDLARRARQELRALLAGEQIGIDVVGYVAAAGGGLTQGDLSDLLGVPPLRLGPFLRSVFGRSLETRGPADFRYSQAATAGRVYLFAHEELRLTAEQQLGGEMARYRQRIHKWIRSYADGDWPDTTPSYAMRGYPRLLAATRDAMRLSVLARDPRRHAFLLRATGNDYAALAEIKTAQTLIIGQHVPDLRALVELAVYRHAISNRNQSIPVALPAVWARLDRFDYAEALARTIPDPQSQVQALTKLANVAIEASEMDRASRLAAEAEAQARVITDLEVQGWTFVEVANTTARAGNPDRAEALARAIPYEEAQDPALIELVRTAAESGDLDRAQALARAINGWSDLIKALAELAGAAAQAGDLDCASRLAAAEAVACTIYDPSWRARALTALASVAAQVGDVDRASPLAAETEALARTLTDPSLQAQALAEVASAAAQAGDLDRASRLAAEAEALAHTITALYQQAQILTEVASVAAQVGDLDRAEALARTTHEKYQARALVTVARVAAQAGNFDWAQALARTITSPLDQGQALVGVARVAVQAGDLDRAEALARTISPYWRAKVLIEVATAAAEVGDFDRAVALADAIPYEDELVQALAAVATAAAQAHDSDRASWVATDVEALARSFIEPFWQAQALTALADVAAQAGDRGRAVRLAADAEALARTISHSPVKALAALVDVAAQAGDLDRAEALARTIDNSYDQARALAEVATAAVQLGDRDSASRLAADAEVLARAITNPYWQAQVLTGAANAATQASDLDRLEDLAHTIDDSHHQVNALTELARAATRVGDPERASRLIANAEAVARAITDPHFRAGGLTEVASAAAQAGDLDRAEALVRTITGPFPVDHAEALAKVASAAAQAGDLDRAEALTRSITHWIWQARALIVLATAAAQASDPERASRLAAQAQALVGHETGPYGQERMIAEVASAAAQAGDLDRAETLAHTITDKEQKVWALTEVACAATRIGDGDSASRVAADAEALARTITDPDEQAQALGKLASAAAQAGDIDRARHLLALALSVDSPDIRWQLKGVSHLFPSTIREAGDVLANAYTTGRDGRTVQF